MKQNRFFASFYIWLLLLTFAGLASPASPASPASTADRTNGFAIRNVRIYDGIRVLEKATVVVRDGFILAVGRVVALPGDIEVIDGSNKTLIPGLIDSHIHLFPGALEQSILFGVTTDIDMFTGVPLMQEAKKKQRTGECDGRADFISSGTLATAPGGHGTEYGLAIPVVSSPQEAGAFVDARLAEGSDFIKIIYDDFMPTISRETLAALIKAAHRRGKLAVVHATLYQKAFEALQAGADGLAHVWVDRLPGADFLALAARQKTFVIPTLTVVSSLCGRKVDDAFPADPALALYLTPADLAKFGQTFPKPVGSYSLAEESVRMLARRGITILAGTDAPNPGTVFGASLHLELELLVRAGLTPIQALAAATVLPAGRFRLDDRGRIRAGLRADLVLLDGNPLEDIRATRRIVSVWKKGIRFDREPGRREAERLKQADAAALRSPPPAGSESGLISDFEENGTATRFGAGWAVSTDAYAGGKSRAEMKVVGGEVAPGLPFAWSGVIFFPGAAPFAAANLSAKKEISFWVKGDGRTYNLSLFTRGRGFFPLVRTFPTGSDWSEVVIALAKFEGGDGHDITGISFTAGPQPGAFSFQIDDIGLK